MNAIIYNFKDDFCLQEIFEVGQKVVLKNLEQNIAYAYDRFFKNILGKHKLDLYELPDRCVFNIICQVYLKYQMFTIELV